MPAVSYHGHPGKLIAIIQDNLARMRQASPDEQAERIRAHCDFIRTAGEVHLELTTTIRDRHGWRREEQECS